MVKLEDAVIARIEKNGEHFEILVDPALALKLKKGETVSFNDLLVIDTVFKDAKKGSEQSPESLNKAFATVEINEVAEKIIMQGEVQLTTDQRRTMREAKKKEIIAIISRNALNPQTNAPHPPKRIEIALEEAKIMIDENKRADEQVSDILKELKKIIPISFEKQQIAIKVPAEQAGRVSAFLHKHDLKKEQWMNDGSLVAIVETPAGLRNEFLTELNHLTHGDVETKIMEKGD
ncbi:MAG: ribosome assembly factor SBDS [Candidatus Diapherotrites archaeon]|uniref:Ribosome assembly factor SBDS n=1 Tax=Candidatus Iainarchaeum sp. TaxID=3101447 RepID=A0A2D6M1J5_9ARCH|nr:ribosome assembly factor SBDS [Candidatus Diapherotrites archaeon]|tara:strand:+ start:4178 stop:4879 length:702 start_codon:yes stop_codon:yes gene_type:complete